MERCHYQRVGETADSVCVFVLVENKPHTRAENKLQLKDYSQRAVAA